MQISKILPRKSLTINDLQKAFMRKGFPTLQNVFFAFYPFFYDFTKNLHLTGTKSSEK